MANVTPGYTWASGNTVTADLLNQAVDNATVTNIVNADIDNSAAIALSKLATGALPTAITVASANLVSATQQSLVPAGAVMPFARSTAPAGWLIANGNAVPNGSGTVQGVTADFSALYAALGTAFGAAGTLPNLQGIFVRGSGSQTISGTAYSGTFAAKQQDALKTHTHDISNVKNANTLNAALGATAYNQVHNGFTDATTDGPSTGSSSETRPANIALLYCIKF